MDRDRLQKQIEKLIKDLLINEMAQHNRRRIYQAPFTQLLGKDRLGLYSLMQSLNAAFGAAIYEPVLQKLASGYFQEVSLHQSAGSKISSQAQNVINEMIDKLAAAYIWPNKPEEIEAIRAVCTQGEMRDVKLTKVDVKLIDNAGSIYLIDIKTAKPNIGGFKEFKRSLLEWVAVVLAENPDADIHTLVAIPYNPYEPKAYDRWTIRGMLDLEHELKVGKEFWDYLGGEGAYEMLLDTFENVGIELRPVIDEYFARFAKR